MLSAREALYGLYGAYRLARFDRAGMGYFDTTPSGALASFKVLWLTLPMLALSYLLLDAELGRPENPGQLVFLLLVHLVEWFGFLVLVEIVARRIDRDSRFPAFVAAHNWTMAIKVGALLAVVLAAAFGVFGTELSALLMIIVFVGVVVYRCFVYGVALDVPVPAAVGLVFIEIMLSLVILNLSQLPGQASGGG